MSDEPRSIVHLIDSGGLYGAERMLLTLAELTGAAGHRVAIATLVAPHDRGNPLGDEARSRGIDVREVFLHDGLRLRDFRRLTRDLCNDGYTVVHGHGYKANVILGLNAGVARSAAFVATLHGWTATSRWSRMGVYEALERRLLGRLDGVAAVSERILRRIDPRGRDDRCALIPNGIAPASASAVEHRAIADFVAGQPAILAVGRLSKEKGYSVLLEAFASVLRTQPAARLVIIGDGPERAALERRAAELGIHRSVLWPGYVQDARHAMHRFTALAISSWTEGLPLVALEAMTEGLPIVSTAVGELPAVLQHGNAGALVAPGDIGALADALLRVLGDAEYRTELRTAASAAARHYTADNMTARYLDFYRRALLRRDTRSRAPAQEVRGW